MSEKKSILAKLAQAANRLELPLMLIGAGARDFWIEHCKLPVSHVRTTQDIDLACQVESWMEYKHFLESLVSNYGFAQDRRNKQRLFHEDNTPVDIVPFGPLENLKGEISWPPEYETTMNMLGFQAAYNDALTTEFNGLQLRVVRPQWLALLKMNAFTDNPERHKDLKDLYFIIDNYLDLIDEDQCLHKQNAPDADILCQNDFDTRVAGAALIARHCKKFDGNTTFSLQKNIRDFNRDGGMTTTFARLNDINLDLAERIFKELLDENHCLGYD